jgi:hypothetical protein
MGADAVNRDDAGLFSILLKKKSTRRDEEDALYALSALGYLWLWLTKHFDPSVDGSHLRNLQVVLVSLSALGPYALPTIVATFD